MLKPEWLRVKAPQRERIGAVSDLLLDLNLNTVCQEASCPNIGECFARRNLYVLERRWRALA